MPWEKVLAFLKSHPCTKKPENNRFRVPIHFATNRFTFEKISPLHPLLHPNIFKSDWVISFILSFFGLEDQT